MEFFHYLEVTNNSTLIKNMNTELINNLYKISEDACKAKSNIYGYGIWSHHIQPMVPIAQRLAKEFGADEEIVTIATLLHDLAGIQNSKDRDRHHIIGAQKAEEILLTYNYPTNKIESVKFCIINHRSSINKRKNTIEEVCVADADAIVHMTEISSLFYAAYIEMKMNIEDGKTWIRKKIQRDWEKMSEQSRSLYKLRFNAILEVLK